MHSTVNHIIQLQELVLIRDEHRALSEGAHLDRLNDAIDSLTSKLPSQARSVFNRLRKRDQIVAAPINEKGCAMCGMKLPISQVQAVRKADTVQYCPSCARVLFWTDVPRWTGTQPSRLAPRKVGISRFSHKDLMIPELESTTRDGAIEELAGAMQEHGFIEDAKVMTDLALDREAILSTAVDCGIAYPHVRGVEGGGLTLAMGLSRKGIQWGDDHDDPAHFVFFFVIPTAVSAFYLKLLAGLTETFVVDANRNQMLEVGSMEEMWKLLTRLTRYTVR